jgi:hypothetical protein
VQRTLLEIAGRRGRLVVVEDPDTGGIYAVVPWRERVAPAKIREVRELTLDYWRHVSGVGLVLDLTAWARESGVTQEDIRERVEKYGELVDRIIDALERGGGGSGAGAPRGRRGRR